MEIDYKKRQRIERIKEVCGAHVYPWLRSLGKHAEKEGIYPLSLADLYPDPRDKEIAAVVEIGAPSTRKEQYATEYRNILGGNLHDKIARRDFMELAGQETILGAVGFRVSGLFNMLDWIWSVIYFDKVPLEYAILGELDIIKKRHSTPITQAVDFVDLRWRMEMALVKMTLKGGFGCGQWDFLEEKELPFPISSGLKTMLLTFCPVMPVLTPREMMRIIGIKTPKDMLYIFWGYEWAKKLHTLTVERLQKKIARQYRSFELGGVEVPKKLLV